MSCVSCVSCVLRRTVLISVSGLEGHTVSGLEGHTVSGLEGHTVSALEGHTVSFSGRLYRFPQLVSQLYQTCMLSCCHVLVAWSMMRTESFA